jgi:hypothetical protein
MVIIAVSRSCGATPIHPASDRFLPFGLKDRFGRKRIPSFVSSTVDTRPGFQPLDSRMALGIVIALLEDMRLVSI